MFSFLSAPIVSTRCPTTPWIPCPGSVGFQNPPSVLSTCLKLSGTGNPPLIFRDAMGHSPFFEHARRGLQSPPPSAARPCRALPGSSAFKKDRNRSSLLRGGDAGGVLPLPRGGAPLRVLPGDEPTDDLRRRALVFLGQP